jgi:prepilin-type N-terminal cleavage/methylation domain-containing protein
MNAWGGQDSRKRSRKRFLSLTGFTLIEIVMAILIISVLSMAGYHIMRFTIQNSFFLPNQVQTDLAAAEALEIMVEGDTNTVRGLRFCKSVSSIAANDLTVIDQDDAILRFWLDTLTGKLYRSIDGVPPGGALIPYFKPDSVRFSGNGGALFTYYDSAGAVTAVAANVRLIAISLIAQQGAGSVDSFEGVSRQSTSIRVSKFQ